MPSHVDLGGGGTPLDGGGCSRQPPAQADRPPDPDAGQQSLGHPRRPTGLLGVGVPPAPGVRWLATRARSRVSRCVWNGNTDALRVSTVIPASPVSPPPVCQGACRTWGVSVPLTDPKFLQALLAPPVAGQRFFLESLRPARHWGQGGAMMHHLGREDGLLLRGSAQRVTISRSTLPFS